MYRTDDVPTLLPVEALGGEFPARDVAGARVRSTVAGDLLEVVGKGGEWTVLRGPADCISGLSAAESAGGRMLVWDEYTGGTPEAGGSYDVVGAWAEGGKGYGVPFAIATGPRFQARTSLAAHPDGSFFVAWEEGSDGWGAEFRSVDRQWNNPTDIKGPLHSWRAVRLAQINADATGLTEIEVPMASFAVQGTNPERRPGAEKLGVFYERPFLHVDGDGALWLGYRHMHQSEAGCLVPRLTTHIERGFVVDVRSYADGSFGPLLRLGERQRDGEQRATFTEDAGGSLAIVYETGRRDRRKDKQPAGVMGVDLGVVEAGGPGTKARLGAGRELVAAPGPKARLVAPSTFADAAGTTFTLAFGDLHRHTDLSLCFPFFDGSIDDAYRYARGPGALDFLGLTDHARDLDQGRGGSRPWQLTVAAADRHHLGGRFAAFRSYERSQGNTDHNVVSLREDADFLRPHTPPLTEFWSEFDAGSLLTIPHATSHSPGARFCGDVWQKRDDLRRPIAEIYQGMRDVSSIEELQTAALLTGQKLGFIASSDHLSTRAAYACVWAEGEPAQAIDRGPIFRALKERRCYGATARIELRMRSGQAWMGEDLEPGVTHLVEIEVKGTGAIERIDLWSGGEVVHTLRPDAENPARRTMGASWPWEAPARQGYLFAHVVQKDGHQAWSSPFFSGWDE